MRGARCGPMTGPAPGARPEPSRARSRQALPPIRIGHVGRGHGISPYARWVKLLPEALARFRLCAEPSCRRSRSALDRATPAPALACQQAACRAGKSIKKRIRSDACAVVDRSVGKRPPATRVDKGEERLRRMLRDAAKRQPFERPREGANFARAGARGISPNLLGAAG